MHVTLSSAVGIQTPVNACPRSTLVTPVPSCKPSHATNFLYGQDLLYNLDAAWCICSDRCYIRKSCAMINSLTDSFRYPSIFVQVAKEQAVDHCRLSKA